MAEEDLRKRLEAAARKAKKVGVFSLGDLNDLLNPEAKKKEEKSMPKPRVPRKAGGMMNKKKVMPKKAMKK